MIPNSKIKNLTMSQICIFFVFYFVARKQKMQGHQEGKSLQKTLETNTLNKETNKNVSAQKVYKNIPSQSFIIINWDGYLDFS